MNVFSAHAAAQVAPATGGMETSTSDRLSLCRFVCNCGLYIHMKINLGTHRQRKGKNCALSVFFICSREVQIDI